MTSSTVTPPQDLDLELEALCRGSNLTAAQALAWANQQRHASLPIHQTALLWIIPAEIDPARFEKAFQQVVDGCDALRTVIEEQAGMPFQRVLPEVRCKMELIDLADSANPVEAARSWAVERSQRLFALDRQLFDSALLRLGNGQFAWYLNQHRVIADGWSALLIFRRTAEAYQAAPDATPEALPAVPQFSEFAAAERQFAGTSRHQKARTYWQQKLAKAPAPVSFGKGGTATPGTPRVRFSCAIGLARSQRLREICAGPAFAGAFQNLSLFSLFTGLFLTCLHHRTGQQRFALGIPASARASRKLEDTAGLCTHMVVEHFDVAPDDTILALSGKVRSEMVEVLRQQAFAVSTLPPRKLYDAVINFCHGKAGTFLGNRVQTEFIDPGHQDDSQEKLALQVRDYDATAQFSLDFDFGLDAFDAAAQQEVVRHFFGIMDAFLEGIELPLRELCPTAPETISERPGGTALPASSGSESPAPRVPVVRTYVAPGTPVEKTLARHWQEALGLDQVGIHDNFFDIGGRSLLAVGLFARIEEEFGINLPIATLLDRPTIAQLAEFIAQGDPTSRWPSLVTMQAGAGPALYCVHGVRGDILRFRDLSKRLDPNRAIYGLRARGLDGNQSPHETVEAMAADYAAEVVNAQPQGPYFLIGYSFGGLVAYEMARQLSQQGREIGLVALIDTRRKVTRKMQLLNLLFLPLDQKFRLGREMIHQWFNDRRLGLGRPASPVASSGDATASRAMRIDQVRYASLRAAVRYEPQPYAGRVIFFEAGEFVSPRVMKMVSYPWKDLALGGFDFERLPYSHGAMLLEPDVHFIAGRLAAKLAAAGMPDSRASRNEGS